MGRANRGLRLTAAEPRAVLNSATITVGTSSPECGRLRNYRIVLPLLGGRVPVIYSRRTSVAGNANMIGVAPTRSPGSFRINLHRGLPVIHAFACSNRVANGTSGRFTSRLHHDNGTSGSRPRILSYNGCTNVAALRTHGTVMGSLRSNKCVGYVRPLGRSMNAYCHYRASVRPVISGR